MGALIGNGDNISRSFIREGSMQGKEEKKTGWGKTRKDCWAAQKSYAGRRK